MPAGQAAGAILLAGVAAAYLFGHGFDTVSILVGASLAAAWVYKRLATSDRSAVLSKLASKLGLSFRADDRWLRDSGLFRHVVGECETRTTLANVFAGSAAGSEMLVFDYARASSTALGGGETVSATLIAFRDDGHRFPRFHLGPEDFFDKIAAALGGRDIDLDGLRAFSDAFRLRGEDDAAMRALFTDDVVEALDPELGWVVWTVPGWLLATWGVKPGLTDTVQVGELIRRGVGMGLSVDAIPSFIERSTVLHEALCATANVNG